MSTAIRVAHLVHFLLEHSAIVKYATDTEIDAVNFKSIRPGEAEGLVRSVSPHSQSQTFPFSGVQFSPRRISIDLTTCPLVSGSLGFLGAPRNFV